MIIIRWCSSGEHIDTVHVLVFVGVCYCFFGDEYLMGLKQCVVVLRAHVVIGFTDLIFKKSN